MLVASKHDESSSALGQPYIEAFCEGYRLDGRLIVLKGFKGPFVPCTLFASFSPAS